MMPAQLVKNKLDNKNRKFRLILQHQHRKGIHTFFATIQSRTSTNLILFLLPTCIPRIPTFRPTWIISRFTRCGNTSWTSLRPTLYLWWWTLVQSIPPIHTRRLTTSRVDIDWDVSSSYHWVNPLKKWKSSAWSWPPSFWLTNKSTASSDILLDVINIYSTYQCVFVVWTPLCRANYVPAMLLWHTLCASRLSKIPCDCDIHLRLFAPLAATPRQKYRWISLLLTFSFVWLVFFSLVCWFQCAYARSTSVYTKLTFIYLPTRRCLFSVCPWSFPCGNYNFDAIPSKSNTAHTKTNSIKTQTRSPGPQQSEGHWSPFV